MASYTITAINGETVTLLLKFGDETLKQQITAATSDKTALLAKLDAYTLAVEHDQQVTPEPDLLPSDVKALIGVERVVKSG